MPPFTKTCASHVLDNWGFKCVILLTVRPSHFWRLGWFTLRKQNRAIYRKLNKKNRKHNGAADADPKPGIDNILVVGKPSRFGATKSEIPILETPRSVAVITQEEFNARGALSLSNTLNYTAGVTGNAFGFATRGDFTSIRSLDAPEYQDNLQVLFGTYNNARADIYTLEQVEVLKGPASVLYGQAAPGGIVSTVSKVAGPDRLGKEVVFTAGNYDRYQGSVDMGFDLSGDGRFTARFVGIYRNSDTQVDYVNDDAIVIAPSLTFEDDRTSITALFNFTDRNSDASSQFLPLSVTGCGDNNVFISEPNVCAGTTGAEVDPTILCGRSRISTNTTPRRSR